MTRRRQPGPGQAVSGRAPAGVRSTVVETPDGCFAVLSYPLPGASPTPGLTATERAVLALVLAGRSNAAIALERGTAVRTVANQVASIFRKHGVSSRSELIALLARDA